MNITKVRVHDPTLEGLMERPYLVVEIDEEPEITQGPDHFPGGWTISRYGPFYVYNRPGKVPTAADFNARFDDMPPLVDVEVVHEVRKPGSYFKATYGVGTHAIQLQRARQLLRRHARDWRLMASDHDMQARRLLWTPVQANATCRHWLGDHTCGASNATRIRIGDLDMPLCQEHKTEYLREQAEFQAAFKG